MAALLTPEFYARFCRDMNCLEMLLKGKLPEQPYDDGQGDYRILAGAAEVAAVVQGWSGDVAIDTEGYVSRPWSLQFSLYAGHGYVVRAGDFDGLSAFRDWLQTVKPRIVFHNALWDIGVLRAMGIDIVEMGVPFTDTQVEAYLVAEPQGLKSLALRLAGVEQEEYLELVAELAEEVAREWLADIAWSRFERNYGPKPSDLEKALRLVERMLLKDAKTPVRERWAACRAREILVDEMLLVGEMPQPTLDMIPLEKAVRYSGRDTDCTIRVAPILSDQVKEMGVEYALQLDLGILPCVERMQTVGMQVDVAYLHDLSSVLAAEHATTVEMICQMAGRELNPSSGPQVAEWLFNDLGLPWKKKTKKGDRPSADRKILKTLAQDYSIDPDARKAVQLILEARGIQKDKSFCDCVEDFLGSDGRLHPHLMLTRTGTGRTAAKDPNILAFPKHSARGRLIRGGFVAGEGRMLGEWDLSQIDLRALAIDSGDEKMIAQFNSGHDFHLMGAAGRYGLAPEDVSKAQRYSQKKVNFAIPMGTTQFGLCESYHQDGFVDKTPPQCLEELEAWYADYSGATAYISSKHAEARRHGFVRTWTGRLRYLEGVRSMDKYAVAEALRQAQATPIQGGARDIVKMWIIEVWKRMPELWAEGIWAEAILDVHDSILIEFDIDALPKVERVVQDALSSIQQFVIPITGEGSTGSNWGEL